MQYTPPPRPLQRVDALAVPADAHGAARPSGIAPNFPRAAQVAGFGNALGSSGRVLRRHVSGGREVRRVVQSRSCRVPQIPVLAYRTWAEGPASHVTSSPSPSARFRESAQ